MPKLPTELPTELPAGFVQLDVTEEGVLVGPMDVDVRDIRGYADRQVKISWLENLIDVSNDLDDLRAKVQDAKMELAQYELMKSGNSYFAVSQDEVGSMSFDPSFIHSSMPKCRCGGKCSGGHK